MSDKITHQLLHDVRNPLNAISMNAELGKMLLEKEQVEVEIIIKLFQTIYEQCKNCSDALQKFE